MIFSENRFPLFGIMLSAALMPFRGGDVQGSPGGLPRLSAARPSFHAIVRHAAKRGRTRTESIRHGAVLGDGLGAGGRYPDWCGCHRVVAACSPALVGAPIHGRAPSLPAHCPCRDQRADAAWPAADSARHRVADDAARKRDGRHSRPTARPGDHLPARLGRADGAAYRRRSLSQAFSAQPHGQPAGAQARDAGPRI